MKTADGVRSYLFAESKSGVYTVLDGASVEGLLDRLQQYEPECECLYRGEIAPDIAEVAPYLVGLDRRSAFSDWVIDRGWGNHWGVFIVSRSNLPTLRRHFRRLLTVHDDTGKPLLFRYYDPRVMRAYLPTCTPAELEEMFGPVMHYIMEGENPAELLRFQFANGNLSCNTKNLTEEV
jgi:hypothetical protein